jgi:hypothetical protein
MQPGVFETRRKAGARAQSHIPQRTGVLLDALAYRGSRFMDVWRTLKADAYDQLPAARIGLRDLRSWLQRAALARAAKRTLDARCDLLPPFRKLVHPYGIALRGSWRITRETPFTGYFATGSEALIIARASDALGEHRPGKLRFLGLAGKLYPTTNPHHKQLLRTANFFTLENLGGSHTARFVEASLGNDLLPLVPHLGASIDIPLGAVLGPAFAYAERTLDFTQLMIRQLYPIAELGEANPERAQGPRFLKLVGTPSDSSPLSADLREELDMKHHPYGIRFEIHVAEGLRIGPKAWHRIGEIHFTDSVASLSGDTRLHFAHAPYQHGRAERV